MSDFEKFYFDLLKLVRHFEKNSMLKIEKDPNYDIIKILGGNATVLSKAKNGLNDITELSYTSAEHHPYWNLLYNTSEIIHVILNKWDDTLSAEDMSEIKWAVKEISETLKKIEDSNETPDI